ncbi:MAG: ABC transporter permease [Gammaproteobacteria bacterium]|nr:ABC transporter permease [Gammaproteobacteria bacterium]
MMIKALLKKEFIDAIRDKRSVFAALLGAFFTPLFFAGMMIFTLEKSDDVESLYIEINNQEQAPHIVELLAQDDIFHADIPEQGKHFQLDGEKTEHSKISLTFASDFKEKLAAGEQAELTIVSDNSKQESRSQLRRIKGVINNYQGQLVSMKLMARGISPVVMQPLKIVENDTSSPTSKSAMILGMLGVMILVTLFVSSTNVAIDCSAGERERNSLELLLMQPVSTFDVVVAKVVNASAFSVIGATLTIILTSIVIPFIPLHKLGAAFNFDLAFAVSLWLIVLPLAFFAAAFQLTAAFHAKSFKEAQSYIQYTVMVPIILPMMLEISNYKHAALSYLPVVGQQQAISQLFRGELESFTPVLIGSLVTLLTAAALVKFIARSLKSEKVVLGL